MVYKSEKQFKALQKQAKFLREYNKLFSKDEEELIKKLYIEGLSCNQLAKKFNCSKCPILRIIKDLPKRKATDYKNHRCYNQWSENNTAWKGGMKSIYDRVRGLTRYWEWRNFIVSRDNNMCAECGSDSNLEVHHKTTLKTLIEFYCQDNKCQIQDLTEADLLSDYFYDVNNGITYCKSCHKKHHKKFGR